MLNIKTAKPQISGSLQARSSPPRFQTVAMGLLPLQNASSPIALTGSEQNKSSVTTSAVESKPKKKICCACPDTKRLRDECIVEHGEAACAKWVKAHLQCLRAEGFNV